VKDTTYLMQHPDKVTQTGSQKTKFKHSNTSTKERTIQAHPQNHRQKNDGIKESEQNKKSTETVKCRNAHNKTKREQKTQTKTRNGREHPQKLEKLVAETTPTSQNQKEHNQNGKHDSKFRNPKT